MLPMGELVDRARWTARNQGLSTLVLKALRYPVKPFFVPGASRKLHDGHRRVDSLSELYEFVNGFNYRGITITSWQKKAEIVDLLRLLERARPRRVAEIGTANGGTLFMLTQIAAPDATIVSVDLPGRKAGRGLELGATTGTRGGAVASIADSHAKTSRSTCFEPTRVLSRRLKACVDAYREERSTFSSSTATTATKAFAETSSSTPLWWQTAGWWRFTTSFRPGQVGPAIPAMCRPSGARSGIIEGS
jgi:hypothetical protein